MSVVFVGDYVRVGATPALRDVGLGLIFFGKTAIYLGVFVF